MLIILVSGSGIKLALVVRRMFPMVVVVVPTLIILCRYCGGFHLRSWRWCWVVRALFGIG